MKRLSWFVIALLAAAPTVEAARVKLPKPIDSPVVRPKIRDDHKPGKRNGNHAARYERSDWGNEWDRILNVRRAKAIPPWLVVQD